MTSTLSSNRPLEQLFLKYYQSSSHHQTRYARRKQWWTSIFLHLLKRSNGIFWHYHVRNQVKQNNTLTLILTLSNFNEMGHLFLLFKSLFNYSWQIRLLANAKLRIIMSWRNMDHKSKMIRCLKELPSIKT